MEPLLCVGMKEVDFFARNIDHYGIPYCQGAIRLDTRRDGCCAVTDLDIGVRPQRLQQRHRTLEGIGRNRATRCSQGNVFGAHAQ